MDLQRGFLGPGCSRPHRSAPLTVVSTVERATFLRLRETAIDYTRRISGHRDGERRPKTGRHVLQNRRLQVRFLGTSSKHGASQVLSSGSQFHSTWWVRWRYDISTSRMSSNSSAFSPAHSHHIPGDLDHARLMSMNSCALHEFVHKSHTSTMA